MASGDVTWRAPSISPRTLYLIGSLKPLRNVYRYEPIAAVPRVSSQWPLTTLAAQNDKREGLKYWFYSLQKEWFSVPMATSGMNCNDLDAIRLVCCSLQAPWAKVIYTLSKCISSNSLLELAPCANKSFPTDLSCYYLIILIAHEYANHYFLVIQAGSLKKKHDL